MKIWNRLVAGLACMASAFSMAQSLDDFLTAIEPASQLVKEAPFKNGPTSALDLKFMENRGQWQADHLYRLELPGMTYWATTTGFVVDAYVDQGDLKTGYRNGHVLRFDLAGSTGRGVKSQGKADSGVKIDFIKAIGKNRVSGVNNVRAFGEATVNNVLPGVDVRHYQQNGTPRYDFVVKPGVNPNNLSLTVDGAQSLSLDNNGNLMLGTSIGMLRMAGLEAYQVINGQKKIVPSSFRLTGNKKIAFNLGKYDKTVALVIDPLVYGTLFGGSSGDIIADVVSDSSGSVYFVGSTVSTDVPITTGPYSVDLLGQQDGFIAQISEDAFDVNYVAYIAGFFTESTEHVQVDQYGDVWIAGLTNTPGFVYDQFLKIENVRPDETVTGGDFVLRVGSAANQTDPLAWNSSAGDIEAALEGLPLGPPSGYTVTGGPLPDTPVEIRWNTAEFGTNITVIDDTRPYASELIDPTAIEIAMSDGPGLIPNAGTFRLSVFIDNQTFLTDWIPFNAGPLEVADALNALQPFTDGTPTAVPLGGGPLPDNPVQVGFTDNNSNPVNAPAITVISARSGDTDGLRGGQYGFLPDKQSTYVVRLERSLSETLDPLRIPTSMVLKNTGFVNEFVIRPQPEASGDVEFYLLGDPFDPTPNPNTGRPSGLAEFLQDGTPVDSEAVESFPGAVPPFAQFGYLAGGRASRGVSNAQLLSSRSTYIGGRIGVLANDVAVDLVGSVYVTGEVLAQNNISLPANNNIFHTTSPVFTGGNLLRKNDGFIRKYRVEGSLAFAYSAVFGSAENDTAKALDVDPQGNVYILGLAGGNSFPRTLGSFDEIMAGGKPYALKINANATSILYSTSLRSVATPQTIAVDNRGNAYLGFNATTRPDPFPDDFISITPNAPALPGQEAALDSVIGDAPPNFDGGMMVLNSAGSGLFYGGYYGLPGVGPFASTEILTAISLDRTGGVWVAGWTDLLGLQNNMITSNAFQSAPNGGQDGWLVKQRISLPTLDRITLTPSTIPASLGAFSDLNVLLRGPAPAPGVTIRLRIVDPTVARFNSESGPGNLEVTIPTGATQLAAPIQVFSRPIAGSLTTIIEARLDADLVRTGLNVVPWLETLSVSQTEIRGGNTFFATVRLSQVAPAGGINVNMTTDSPQFINFPGNGLVNIAAGQQSVTFQVGTQGVNVNTPVSITANLAGASATRNLTLLPAIIKSISIDPSVVTGGERSNVVVTLDGKAGSNTVVRFTQTGMPIGFDAAVKVPQNASDFSQPLGTDWTPTDTTAILTASLNSTAASDTLFILHNQIQSLTLNQTSVEGGTQVLGTVRLTRPAGPTGVNVPILNTKPQFCSISPATVFIPAGQVQGQFTIQTLSVTEQQTVRFRASKAGYNRPFADLVIRPFSATVSVSVDPNSVSGGANTTGTVRINRAAPAGGLAVNLASSNTAVALTPSFVVIPAGSTQRTFTVNTFPVATSTTVTISATLGSQTATALLNVLPANITGFSFNPISVPGGQGSNATIRIDTPAPTGGLPVLLAADQPQFVGFPSFVIIPAGQTSIAFPVSTNIATRNIAVTFTASVQGRSPRTATLFITGTP